MPTKAKLQVPTRPDALDVPTYRYWGERKPPKNRAEFWSVTAAEESESSTSSTSTSQIATLRMYGPIDPWGGWFGISARDVSEALDQLGEVDEIRVRINSPGGDVWEGMAILNMLRAHKARVVTIVDGIAASSASFIAAGSDETVMSPGTQMMIHDASTFAYGPAALMRKAATMLDSVSDSIASIYAEVAGGTDADWRALMVETTWYTAKEAVEANLADRVAVVPDAGSTDTAGEDEEPAVSESETEGRFDLSMYVAAHHTPKPPTASADGSITTQEGSSAVAFTDEQITAMRTKLGLSEDADEATIAAALDEALEERAEPTPQPTEGVPEGHVVVPEARLSDLEASARQGVEAARKLQEREREEFLDSNRTKFAPANRLAWAKEYDRDPEGTRKHFDAAADIVPMDSLGHAGEPETTADDELYVQLFGEEKGA